jgi:6-phosphogluconolactonase (cycloisomerase 2 family)
MQRCSLSGSNARPTAAALCLPAPNNRDDSTYNVKSRIYRLSTASGRFELVQEVDTSGAVDWEAFTLNGTAYLAVANRYDGSSYNVKSRIYRPHSTISDLFELWQEIDTSGAQDWEVFTLEGAAYLALANYYDGSSFNVKSCIYRFSALSDQFEVVQEVDTSGATSWEAFALDGATYLAVANMNDGSTINLKSRIYRHSAMSDRFELVQEVDTSGARDWEAFTLDGATYLALANQYDGSTFNVKSRIYRYSAMSDQFELVQEVDTSGAHDWEAFTLDGATYLAVANYHDGITSKVKSRIYRLGAAPC